MEDFQGVAGGDLNDSRPNYVTLFDNIEKVGVDVENGTDVIVLGGDGNDNIRLYGSGPDYLTFFGGDGWDRLELTRI